MKATLRLRPEWAGLPRMTAWVDAQVAAFGVEGRQAYALLLCIEELAGNVLLHGDADTLQLTLDAPPLQLVIEDDGAPFDPTAAPGPALPASLDAARQGGRGLLLTRRYSRALDYVRAEGWNRVTVTL